jgi:hypothetical protein
MMLKKVLGISLLCLAAPALAGDLSYDYVEFGYQKVEFDDDLFPGIDIDGDGFDISGSFEVGEDWFIDVGYSKLDFDFGVDLEQLQIGGGWHTDISPNTDFFATLSYVSAEVSASGFGSVDEDGFGATVGVRGMLAEDWELGGSIAYVDLGDGADGTAFSAWLLYSISDAFSAGFTISTDDDLTGYGLSGRFYFGK